MTKKELKAELEKLGIAFKASATAKELKEIYNKDFEANKAEFEDKVLEEKRNKFYTEWKNDLMKKANIQSNLHKLRDEGRL